MKQSAQSARRQIVTSVIGLLPLALVPAAIYVLEYFGRKRMGMMRYLVFMKREFENGLFQPGIVYGIGAVVGVMTLYVFWNALKTKETVRGVYVCWLIYLLGLNLWLNIPALKALKSYHFGLACGLGIVAIASLGYLWRLHRLKKAV